MYKILIAEIKYFSIILTALFLLPLLFTIYAFMDVALFENVYFLKKYFWSMIIGFGVYGFVFIIWSLRKKENRDRFISFLPLSIKELSFIRWLFGIAPFLIVGLYIEIIGKLIPENQLIFISRINAQVGIFFIFLVSFDLIMNVTFLLTQKVYKYRNVILVSVVLLIILISVLMVAGMINEIIKPLPFLTEESYFFIWGLILSVADMIIFSKRRIFL